MAKSIENEKKVEAKFAATLEAMYAEATEKLIALIDKRGVESKHFSEPCLRAQTDEFMFNLDGSRFLIEVKKSSSYLGKIELVDNEGYAYNCSVLKSPDFFALVDHLIKAYSITKARIRKDILKNDLLIPAKQKETGVKLNLQFKCTVKVEDNADLYEDDFYNTEIVFNRVHYLVNSLDLEFV
jgi:hypothetical protein